MSANKLTSEERILAILLFCYPLFLLTVKGGMNTLFFILVAASLVAVFRHRKPLRQIFDGNAIIFTVSMSSSVIAIFLSQVYHGKFDPHPYDAASRFLLSVPIYLALRNINLRAIAVLQYAMPIGVISALFTILFLQHYPLYDGTRLTNSFINPIHLGGLGLMLGLLSLFSINWCGRDSHYVVALKLLGLLAGVYLAVQTESRGAWLAVPFIMLTWIILRSRQWKFISTLYAFVLLTLIMVGSYFSVDVIHQRIDSIYQDLVSFYNGQRDTSVGIRLQHWIAALHLYMQSPVFGIGSDGFAQSMSAMSKSGLITERAAQIGQGEVHSQILASLVSLGIFGLIANLLIYFVPLLVFLRSAKYGSGFTKAASMMGICLTIGYFTFGLTAETFGIKMIASFYSLTLAALLAAATSTHSIKSPSTTDSHK